MTHLELWISFIHILFLLGKTVLHCLVPYHMLLGWVINGREYFDSVFIFGGLNGGIQLITECPFHFWNILLLLMICRLYAACSLTIDLNYDSHLSPFLQELLFPEGTQGKTSVYMNPNVAYAVETYRWKYLYNNYLFLFSIYWREYINNKRNRFWSFLLSLEQIWVTRIPAMNIR